MILSTQNYSLKAYLEGAATNPLPYAVSWVDHNNGVTLSSAGGIISGVGSVNSNEVVAPPAANVRRQIHELTIYNPNLADAIVVVEIVNSSAGIKSVRKKQTLKQSQSLQYTENNGWLLLDGAVAKTTNLNTFFNEFINYDVDATDIGKPTAGTNQVLFYKDSELSWKRTSLQVSDIYDNSLTEGGSLQEFIPVRNFTDLGDTFVNYIGLSGNAVVVNSSGTGLTAVPTSSIGVNQFSLLTDTFQITDSHAGKLVYVREDGTGLSPLASSLFQPSGDYAYLSGASFTGDVTVFAHLAAVTKSFLIRHPFFPLKKLLRYACLEGPENGVYVRGRLTDYDIIELPDYWRKLVDPDSITVQLTPIGSNQKLFIKKIENNKVYIDYESFTDYIKIDCYYLVQAERCDVPKLIVEL